MSTANSLAQNVADAFNQHGKFSARTVEHNLAVEVRHIDSGDLATTLWLPDYVAGWMWFPLDGLTVPVDPREVERRTAIEEVVRAVATSVLDERRSV